MPVRILIFLGGVMVVVAGAVVAAPVARALDWNGQNATTTAGASLGPGGISIHAGFSSSQAPSVSPTQQDHGSNTSGGAANPNQPYGCTDIPVSAANQALLGPGGSTPGQWVMPQCSGPGVVNPLAPVWLPNAAPTAAPPQVDPAVLAQQARSQLALATPAIHMAPPVSSAQLINVPTWLWIDPGGFQALTATATAGPVSATATATPLTVVWDLGDGHQLTCDGPGTPYDPAHPNVATDCSYTWSEPSGGQPDGTFDVTATISWQVSWTASGAPGGGTFGTVAGPTSHAAVQVTESQAINNQGPGGS